MISLYVFGTLCLDVVAPTLVDAADSRIHEVAQVSRCLIKQLLDRPHELVMLMLEHVHLEGRSAQSDLLGPEPGPSCLGTGLLGMTLLMREDVDLGAVCDQVQVGRAAVAEQAGIEVIPGEKFVVFDEVGLPAVVLSEGLLEIIQGYPEQHGITQRLAGELAFLLQEELQLPHDTRPAVQLSHPYLAIRELVEHLVPQFLAED